MEDRKFKKVEGRNKFFRRSSILYGKHSSRETRWFIEKILTKYWIYQNKNNQEMTSLKMLANGQDPLY